MDDTNLIPDQRIVDALEGLRDFVDNFNKAPKLANRGGQFKALDPNQVYTADTGAFTFGYMMQNLGAKLKRKIYIMAPGEILNDIPDEQIQPVLLAVYKVFVEAGQGEVKIYDCNNSIGLKKDTMLITQEIMPMILVERNPRVIVPGSRKH